MYELIIYTLLIVATDMWACPGCD